MKDLAPGMNGQSAVTIIIVLSAIYVTIGGLGGKDICRMMFLKGRK